MELSSAELILSLKAGKDVIYRESRRDVPPPSPKTGRKRRCACGRCHDCAENARWERIFAEKFADANYYSRSTLRSQSPLSSL